MSVTQKRLADDLIEVANRVARERNISLATLSGLVSGDARFLSKIKDGGNFTIQRFDAVKAKLRDMQETTHVS